jgi:membrane fusion protein (multidrug efflux system)
VVSGPVLGEEVIILDGVAPGDRVATSGSFKLREGALVALADSSQRAAKAEGSK